MCLFLPLNKKKRVCRLSWKNLRIIFYKSDSWDSQVQSALIPSFTNSASVPMPSMKSDLLSQGSLCLEASASEPAEAQVNMIWRLYRKVI